MKHEGLSRVRGILEAIRDGTDDRVGLILQLERLVNSQEERVGLPEKLLRDLADLVVDLDGYEPNPQYRARDKNYFGEEELVEVVTSFLEYLSQYGYNGGVMEQDAEDVSPKEEVCWSLRLEGRDTDPALLGCLGELFDGARFRPQDVAYDPEEGCVTVVLIRSRERDRGRWKALRWRMRSGMPRKRVSLVFRGVTSCEEELRSGDRGACLAALSGVDIGPERAYLRCVEEIQRLPVYEIRVAYGRLDVEIVEEGAVLEE